MAFYSLASNLTKINTNGKWNVFIHNISSGQTELVSVTQDGRGINDDFPPMDPIANYVSTDGRFVVLQINSAIITNVNNELSNGLFIRDRFKGTTEKINLTTYNGKQAVGATPSISTNGRYLVFQTSTNGLVKEDNNWGLDVYFTDFGDSKELDTIPPVTTAKLTGIQVENNWYIDSVSVTLNPVDNPEGTGVAKTEYSLDGVNWNIYTAPILINMEGMTNVYYRSIDNAGNQEEIKVQKVNIDNTVTELLEKYYQIGLIDNKGIYQSLKVKTTNNSLSAFINAVEAQNGKHIESTAVSVLLEYAEWIKNNQ